MFDFDVGKLLVFGIVALAVIPAKDLPRVMRTVGQALGKMRRMAKDFQGQFMDAMREADLDSVKKELDGLKRDVEQEVQSLEKSAKLDASFDPAMAVHSELSHASEPPKEVGLSEVPLGAAAPVLMGPLAKAASTETAPAAEATASQDAAE